MYTVCPSYRYSQHVRPQKRSTLTSMLEASALCLRPNWPESPFYGTYIRVNTALRAASAESRRPPFACALLKMGTHRVHARGAASVRMYGKAPGILYSFPSVFRTHFWEIGMPLPRVTMVFCGRLDVRARSKLTNKQIKY